MTTQSGQKNKIAYFLLLHTAFFIFSIGGYFSKSASFEIFLSIRYCCFYFGFLTTMFLYAVIWQQVIKHIDLTVAFANKGITVVWGLLIGKVFFGEEITIKKLIGVIILIVGIIIVVSEEK